MRVPVYRKMFEAGFFLSLLFLYYTVLVERSPRSIGRFEILMDIWIVAFAYDELSGLVDAGVLFYQMDFWSLWNLGIIGVGFAFIITSKTPSSNLPLRLFTFYIYKTTFWSSRANVQITGGIGLFKNDDYILNLSFDILSLEALFLVPRYDHPHYIRSQWVIKSDTKAFAGYVRL